MTKTFNPETHSYFMDGQKVPSVTDILFPITGKGLQQVAPATLQYKAAIGTLVHEYCADIDYGGFDGECELDVVGYLDAYNAFLRDYRPDWEYIEHPVYHEGLGYAGTLDRAGMVRGKFTVCDLKTYASMARAQKIALCAQTYGYKMALESETGRHVEQRLGVLLKKDGTYTAYDARDMEIEMKFNAEETFLSCLRLKKLVEG